MTFNRTTVLYAKDGNEPYWPVVLSLKQGDDGDEVLEHCFFFQKNVFEYIDSRHIKEWLTPDERSQLMQSPEGADALWLADEWHRYYSEVSMPSRYRPKQGDLVLVTEGCFAPWPARVSNDLSFQVKLLDGTEDDVDHYLCHYVGQAANSYIELAMIRPFNAHNAHKALTLIAPRTQAAKRNRDQQHAAIELALTKFIKQPVLSSTTRMSAS